MSYIFGPELICGKMYGAVRASPDFFSDSVLINGLLRPSVRLIVRVLGLGVQGFLE